jgi:hypothetical protein
LLIIREKLQVEKKKSSNRNEEVESLFGLAKVKAPQLEEDEYRKA